MSLEMILMEMSTATIIAAAFGLAGVIVGNIFSMNNFKTKVECEHIALKNGHSDLSKEHSGLSKEYEKNRVDEKEEHKEIKELVTFLKNTELENQGRIKGRMENMSKPEIDTVSVVNTLNNMLDFSKKQGEELKKYMELTDSLKTENAELKAENLKLRKSLEIEEEAEV